MEDIERSGISKEEFNKKSDNIKFNRVENSCEKPNTRKNCEFKVHGDDSGCEGCQ